MHTALIVEDIPETGEWLQALLERAFTGVAVKVCPTCAATRQFVKTNPVSLALVDINLPDGNGLDLIGCILKTSPNAYIITSTIFDDDEHIITALRNGAHGLLAERFVRAGVYPEIARYFDRRSTAFPQHCPPYPAMFFTTHQQVSNGNTQQCRNLRCHQPQPAGARCVGVGSQGFEPQRGGGIVRAVG